MATTEQKVPWVFVSHAGTDLSKVRAVRNFMEDNGAAPLLFHLRSVREPERFWPLIEEEIKARNFFLLCDSAAARQSEWVQREWALVESISRQRSIRVGRISLDEREIDFAAITRFLANLRMYEIFASSFQHSAELTALLTDLGYYSWGSISMSSASVKGMQHRGNMYDDIAEHFRTYARRGWLFFVLDNDLASCKAFQEMLFGISLKQAIFLLTEDITDKTVLKPAPTQNVIRIRDSWRDAVAQAAQVMLAGK